MNPNTSSFSSLIPNTAQVNTIAFDPLNVFAFKAAGTWHLSADYRDANAKLTNAPDGPGNNYNGTWTINCLVINNSLVQSLANVSQDLGGSNSGAAAAPPAGL
jgi:invasion protein IalB